MLVNTLVGLELATHRLFLTVELAGKKELMSYQRFIADHSKQLKGIEDLLDETLGDAWDFTLDPIALQVGVAQP